MCDIYRIPAHKISEKRDNIIIHLFSFISFILCMQLYSKITMCTALVDALVSR